MEKSAAGAQDTGRHWRNILRSGILQAASLLEILLAGLVLIGLLFSAVPLIEWMPGLLRYGNDVEIRSFLERSLDIVIGIEFIKMLTKHSPGSSLEVLMYAIARHMIIGHESALENLLSVCSIALIFIVRKFCFVPSFGSHLPGGGVAPDLNTKPGLAFNLSSVLHPGSVSDDAGDEDDDEAEDSAEKKEEE